MSAPKSAPYGAWKSPITTDLIVSETVGLGQIELDGDSVYWIETRPQEGGRSVIVRRGPDGQLTDLIAPPYNARTRVHEYGGGAFTIDRGTLYFSNFDDQRLYRLTPAGAEPEPLTPAGPYRYADGTIDRRRERLICVCEDHTASEREATNRLVALDLTGSDQPTMLISGSDFYAAPRLSPDGERLAWLSWDHPNMPWDGCELWLADIEADGSLGPARRVAGGPAEAIFQPAWAPDGSLYFVSDRTNWWNIYRWQEGVVEPVLPMEAEFGRPQWIFGLSTYAIESAGQLICSYTQNGLWRLARLDPTTGRFEPIETPYTDIDTIRAQPGQIIFNGASPTEFSGLIRLDLATGASEVLRRSSPVTIDSGYLSRPEALEFPTGNGLTAHAFFYPPQNRDFLAPAGARPPLLVMSHGGPTSATRNSLNLGIQYWTSRGIAVLDVNYGGSSGYGREYRQRLNGQWGLVDVDDCINGAGYLLQQDRVDGQRLAIRGGSAGGYSTLAALTFRDFFRAGASYYGISDLEAMAQDTHKFESRYLDNLIAPYPEGRAVYEARSPLHFVDQITCPVILFQGLEDKVVPPNQAEMILEALRPKGIPVAYLPFEGEQHGFRRAENIKRALNAELYFYSRIFGFEPAEPIEPVTIENLTEG